MYRHLMFATLLSLASGAILGHPRVLQARRQEQRLPPELRSPALLNPRLRQELELTSALHAGEQPVLTTEAEKIPRSEIFKVLAHAGLLARQGRPTASAYPRGRQPNPDPAYLYEPLQWI